ncbi:cupin domain-containing protein [Patescibacteria group bacterium]|nr:cupin domain-containing protein [Patescibacteria group bacterium]
MDSKKVIDELKRKYPGKKIIKNGEDNPSEILCEVDPSTNHPEYSLAVAVIDKSLPHSHKKTTETYKVTKGKLALFIDNKRHELKEGEELIIKPGWVHWAKGNEIWVECYSEPGWTFEDHILEEVSN